MKPGNEIIAHNIKLLRKMDGTTQAEFGEKYGSNQKTIWSYEKGLAKPKPTFLLKLSKGTGIAAETLLSVKLRTDRTGTINNLETKDQQAHEMRKDLKKVMDNFESDLQRFLSAIQSINNRLNSIEQNNKKAGSVRTLIPIRNAKSVKK